MTFERRLDSDLGFVPRGHAAVDPLKLRARHTAAIGKLRQGQFGGIERRVQTTGLGPINHGLDFKPQNCGKASLILEARRNYAARSYSRKMDARQKPIADWMAEVMDRTGLSARAWAEKAKLGKDTVSRAVREDYKNVTTTRTLALLAEAVGERPPGAAGAVPSAESLEAILQVVVDAARHAKPGPDTMRELSLSLRETLLTLADEPGDADDPAVSRALARAAIRRSGILAGVQ